MQADFLELVMDRNLGPEREALVIKKEAAQRAVNEIARQIEDLGGSPEQVKAVSEAMFFALVGDRETATRKMAQAGFSPV